MKSLTDAELWTIAREQQSLAEKARSIELMDKNNMGDITTEEYRELKAIVDRGLDLMLRKAEAMLLLQERGYKITRESLRPGEAD